MTIAVLLWPHANVRYFESMKRLAAAEMEILLHTFDERIEGAQPGDAGHRVLRL